MSVAQILREIEALPPADRQTLFFKLGEMSAADVPESFRIGMAEAARGELLDFDQTLRDLDRP
jgi:hypothetical protein